MVFPGPGSLSRRCWIDERIVALYRRSPGASGSGLGFSNGLKQAELENPAPDKLRGDYHGKNKIFIVVGERISFKPKAGKRKAGTEEPAKMEVPKKRRKNV